MFLDPAATPASLGDALIERRGAFRWGVSCETGRLTDVLVSTPPYLQMVPCNAVTRAAIASGLSCCTGTAARQHAGLLAVLESAGVRCHLVPPAPGLPDLPFTRDAALMTPWGLVELRPAAGHRKPEPGHVRAAAERLGVPCLGRIEEGHVEGGDVCIPRPGLVLIGYSGERTDKTGARALGRLFEERGWVAVYSCFDPQYLHLDTQFTMVSRDCAVACLDVLDDGFVDRLTALGIDLVPVTRDEAERLGANLLSLGGGRIVSPAGNVRLNGELAELGYEVIEVEIDQFVRCGGGIHCLTLPLARVSGAAFASAIR
jgi:N-dimethylarginine dimethylaminohydrolase